MTEWWVSQAKHWCTVCKVWTGGHASQIRKHKDGRGHQEAEAQFLKDSKQREKNKNAEEKDILRQLAQIEKDAAAAMAKETRAEAAAGQAAGQGPQGGLGSVPPPPKGGHSARGLGRVGEQRSTPSCEGSEPRGVRSVLVPDTALTGTPLCSAADMRFAGPPVMAETRGDWVRTVDPGTGHPYYHNTVTKESSWTAPPQFDDGSSQGATAPSVRAASLQTGPTGSLDSSAHQTLSNDGLPAPWIAARDDTGRPYFFNPVTGRSQWEPPAGVAASLGSLVAAAGGGVTLGLGESHDMRRLDRSSAPVSTASLAVPAPLTAASLLGSAPLTVSAVSSSETGVPTLSGTATVGCAGPSTANIAPPAVGTPASSWVVCTDPNTQTLYFFNTTTRETTWERPADLGVDLSNPPPPPPSRPQSRTRLAWHAPADQGLGAWEEVKPEDSMFCHPEEVVNARAMPIGVSVGAASFGGVTVGAVPARLETEEERPLDALIKAKFDMSRRGGRTEEDLELREKEMVEKPSITEPRGQVASFPMSRHRASGIRKRARDE